MRARKRLYLMSLCALPLLVSCTPAVKVEAPEKPIVINLNVKIEHEVRVRVDNDLDQLFENNPNLF